MNKVIIPTGYMGSGSSAITDLLDGIDGVDVSRSTFEFVFLHCPNGVFDLEDKLLAGNNAVRSDEALHTFADTMRQLYNKKYWWVGHYNRHIGSAFWTETERYIQTLTQYTLDYYWYWQENVTPRMVPRLMLNKALKLVPPLRRFIKKPLAYAPMWSSFVTPEEFYAASRDYLYRVLKMMGDRDDSLVLDQLLLPFNLHRFPHYFDDNAEVFVVERDPRDVFISNKYFWNRSNGVVPYPVDVDEFCEFYGRLRAMEKPIDNPHIHRLHFEDLIYKFDETVNAVYDALDIQAESRNLAAVKFQPQKSINNTQLWRRSDAYAAECKVIEDKLGQYLYDFPYAIEHKEQVF